MRPTHNFEPLSLYEEMGADPERYAVEFAKRFALVNTDRGFVDTLEIMRAWFYALRSAVREEQREVISTLTDESADVGR